MSDRIVDRHALNAAKMREALEQISNMGEQIDYQLGSSEETVYAFRNERCLAHNISECARAALSAPPRNCDLFDTKDKAREAFQKLRGHRILADVSLWDDRDEIEALFDWLFAKPKGETK